MPNAHLLKSDICSFPFEKEGYAYLFKAGDKKESLIFCKNRDESFFLQLIDRGDLYLLKSEKITRPTNIKIVQDAIRYFVEKNGLKIVSSNIFSKKNRLKKRSPFLKDILFFKDFEVDGEVEIEIGFGSGRHILHQAKKYPGKTFIGIEIHKPSIEQLLKQCELQGITNILVIDYDARILLQILKSNTVSKIYLHFPVPWDKKPHRRVMSRAFMDECIRVLKPNGRLEIRTDSENYFRYSLEILLSLKKGEFKINKNSSLEVSSKYEDRWRRMEKNIYDLHFINRELSKPLQQRKMVEFENGVDLKSIKRKFSNKTIRGDDYFVHFEKIYKNDEEDLAIIKLSFGDYEKSEHKYMILRDNGVSFLPKEIVPIKQNLLALEMIKEYIYESK